MNFNHYKKIIAREWLTFLIAIFTGIIFSVIIYFNDSSEYIKQRESLYESLKYDFDQFDEKTAIPELQIYRSKKYHKYDDIISDSALAAELANRYPDSYGYLPDKVKQNNKHNSFINYTEFSNILDDGLKRKLFFDSLKAKSDFGEYAYFENKVVRPKFYSGFLKLRDHLFSRRYWLCTFFSLLLPYLIFQFIRSIYYSIKTLIKKGNSP
jgi:hypothetical protein